MFGVRTYMNLYLIIFVLSTMVVAINQFDLVTTFYCGGILPEQHRPRSGIGRPYGQLCRFFAADQAGAQL